MKAERDLALLQYTGGTTGVPKGVMLTHMNLIANTLQSANWCFQVEDGKERYLAVLPCFHVFGLTVFAEPGHLPCRHADIGTEIRSDDDPEPDQK